MYFVAKLLISKDLFLLTVPVSHVDYDCKVSKQEHLTWPV